MRIAVPVVAETRENRPLCLLLGSMLAICCWFTVATSPVMGADVGTADAVAADTEAADTSDQASKPSGIKQRPVGEQTLTRFNDTIQPILAERCFGCHGYGAEEGGVNLDRFESHDDFSTSHEFWNRVLKNVRSGMMPPETEEPLTAEELQAIEQWIKRDALALRADAPDPGRVTMRRLNRTEYTNTIRDLMGVAFKAEQEFPPDDTGYGFDNIGDVLTVSPLHMEKYLEAAQTIVTQAVPTASHTIPERIIWGGQLRDGEAKGDRASFYTPAEYKHTVDLPHAGKYNISFNAWVHRDYNPDPGKCKITLKVGDQTLGEAAFAWASEGRQQVFFQAELPRGKHAVVVQLEPLVPVEQRVNDLELRIESVRFNGPDDPKHWVATKNYKRFFTRDTPPESAEERLAYARELLESFASKAFRRPASPQAVERLANYAQSIYSQPGVRFEEGVAQSMVAALCSPNFLYRIESVSPETSPEDSAPLIDEYSLASRLSYLLWSTMPDEELMRLASQGKLRENFQAQVERMLKDERSQQFTANFTGQWLQLRDVGGQSVNVSHVLRNDQLKLDDDFRGKLSRNETRRFMIRETEMLFDSIVREDQSILRLIDANYTFLNESMAKHYGIPGITGNEMRRVDLPADSVRGGILAHASILVVTSNPTRTSPVKRGLFILENILGSPPPPPPPNIPELEASLPKSSAQPSVRELMALHASNPMCHSCHARMDPLGLALENFNALGLYREKDQGVLIDSKGKLTTGEEFNDINELKRVLVTERRFDFYRCFTEKLLTYSLGRGLEYYDTETVDTIVEQAEASGGKFSTILLGVLNSAPFQRVRQSDLVTDSAPASQPPELSQASTSQTVSLP